MTRLGQAGFETGDTAAYGGDMLLAGPTQSRLSLVSSTPTPRTGNYCLKTDYGGASTATSGGQFGRAKRFNHPSKTEVWYAFGAYLSQGNEIGSGTTLWRNLDASGNQNATLQWDGATLRAYVATAGGGAPNYSTGNFTSIGAAGSVAGGTWVHIDVRYVGATGATGTLEVWVNGTQTLNATSVRTAQTAAAVTDFDLGALRQTPTGALNGTVTLFFAYDDVRWQDTAGSVNNGRAGDEAIRLVVPTSAGDSAQLSRGGTDSGANWSQVDEVPPNSASDYVHSGTVGHTDLYNTTDFPVAAISAINVLAQVANSDGAGGTVYLPTKTGAGQSDGAAVALSSVWAYQSRLLEADPADAAPWGAAKLAALQIGLKIAS